MAHYPRRRPSREHPPCSLLTVRFSFAPEIAHSFTFLFGHTLIDFSGLRSWPGFLEFFVLTSCSCRAFSPPTAIQRHQHLFCDFFTVSFLLPAICSPHHSRSWSFFGNDKSFFPSILIPKRQRAAYSDRIHCEELASIRSPIAFLAFFQ